MTRSALYRGEVVHTRRDAFARRTFRYPVYTAVLDPAELPALAARLRLLGHNQRGLFALDDRDYDGAAGPGLVARHAAACAEAGWAPPTALRLMTNLKVAGYVFNPVSFFMGYGAAGEFSHAIAEVNNTYGGRHRYHLGAAERVASTGDHRFAVTREFFVSPFLHGPMRYQFRFDAPLDGPRLAVQMDVTDAADQRVFVARIAGERVPLTDRALLAAAVRYPLMTAQVIALIHWQALRLHLRRVPYRTPGPDHRPAPAPPAGSGRFAVNAA